MLSSKMLTTPAATNAVSKLNCSHGCRNFRLVAKGVVMRSSFSTPTMLPACALISIASCSNIFDPRTMPTSTPLSSQTG